MANNGDNCSADRVVSEEVNEEDEELKALLDSALIDFENGSATRSATDSATRLSECESSVSLSSRSQSGSEAPPDVLPLSQQTVKSDTAADSQRSAFGDRLDDAVNADFAKFDEMFSPLLNADPELRDHWSKLTKSCAEAANASSDEEFQASLQETLRSISDKAKSVMGDDAGGLSDEELSKIWANLGIAGDGEGGSGDDRNGSAFANLMPIMTNMMQNLLSRDLLYPALSELADKYPPWLSQNKDSLSADELRQYTNQMELMREVCAEFDSERPDDSQAVANERFQRILALMQRMQLCGSPPAQLIGDVPDFGAALPPDLKLADIAGLTGSGGPAQGSCNLM